MIEDPRKWIREIRYTYDHDRHYGKYAFINEKTGRVTVVDTTRWIGTPWQLLVRFEMGSMKKEHVWRALAFVPLTERVNDQKVRKVEADNRPK